MEEMPPEMLQLPSGPVRVAWRRNARARRISVRIDPINTGVVVTLPARASRSAGMALLKSHSGWVADRLAALPDAITFDDGATIPINGVPHVIRHVPHQRRGTFILDQEIHVSGDAAFLARRVTDFLRTEARLRLRVSVAAKSSLIGIPFRRLTVKDTTSRWGSCTADRSLALSWRLVMAPPFVQDYVVAHEVAHLRHMNHGRDFWALVDQLTPHTKAAVPWLRAEGAHLLRIGSGRTTSDMSEI